MIDRFHRAAAALKGDLSGTVLLDESMARHTTCHVGGPAALFIECASISDLNRAFSVLSDEGIPWTVVGKGSNLIVHDKGYRGAVIVLGRAFRSFDYPEEGILVSGAGVSLSRLVQDVFKKGYSGLEFAVGIPGTLGGAIAMNAGTQDEWIGSHVDSVTVLNPRTGLSRYRGRDITWGYRCTSLEPKEVILEAVLRVEVALVPYMQARMEAALKRRKRTQPLDYPSAGSTFRNPEGASAGKLIEEAGLKGFSVGGAQISEMHANFIINTGNATAADVAALVRVMRSKVREVHGVELQQEIRFLGFPE